MACLLDSFGARDTIKMDNNEYTFFNLQKASSACGLDIKKMPFSLRVLFENLLRNEDGKIVTEDLILNFGNWLQHRGKEKLEVPFYPARVLMQDFTGVPAIVDLAAMRDITSCLGGNIDNVNPVIPTHLVIDHSIQVDNYGNNKSLSINTDLEMYRNKERYEFLKWAQTSFSDFTVVPPGSGICHQVNLEYIAQVIFNRNNTLYPDTLVGTDSHTTMINGLSVLGWGVGGIEAESAMLGQPLIMLQPEVIGVKLFGELMPGITSTDLVLTITEILRKYGVVNKFVEFFGYGVKKLSIADRATIANMAPEYGATSGFFAIDEKTIEYLEVTGRDRDHIKIVEQYAKKQLLWSDGSEDLIFTDVIELDLSKVSPSLAGPKRPQDRISLSNVAQNFKDLTSLDVKNKDILCDGSIVVAAITSCTNTSNPSVMIAAGLVAKKAIELGLYPKEFVKTSLSPGSRIVTEYLEQSGLQKWFDEIGFNTTGYGCMTCIGNSGPLKHEFEDKIKGENLNVVSILSGNRNFEGRIHPLTKFNYLASPPLVVAYSLIGNIGVDITCDPIGISKSGREIYLSDIWPTNQEIDEIISRVINRDMFISRYKDIYLGNKAWSEIKTSQSKTFKWKTGSTYIENPPYFDEIKKSGRITKRNEFMILNAHCLLLLGDSITTDHISPAGDIALQSPAGRYLQECEIEKDDFNTYGARRGSHSVMMRGTFANIRIKNEILGGREGPESVHFPTGFTGSIYDVAMRYKQDKSELVIVAGKEYGTGSSRDWAAKGTSLLGVKAVIAESFERIHRSNLVGMGVLPLEFIGKDNRRTLKLDGDELFTLKIQDICESKQNVICVIKYSDKSERAIELLCRIDTMSEVECYKYGGILQYSVHSQCLK